MYSFGYLTVLLYSVSLGFYTSAAFFSDFFTSGVVLGTLSFLGALVMTGLLVKNETKI